MQDKILDKLFEPVYNYFLILLLGYEKVELYICKRVVTKVCLKSGSYLRNRQCSFMLKSALVCIVWHFILADILVNKLDCINTSILSNLPLDVPKLYILSIVIIFIHIMFIEWLNKTFNNHLYGYKIEFGIIPKKWRHEFINIIYMILDCIALWCYFQNNKEKDYFIITSLIAILIGIIIYLITFMWKISVKAITKFNVRARNNNIKEPNTINARTDIAIFLKNNAEGEIIDLFQSNIFIVEDNNILVLGNNVNTLYKKDDIAYIKISNNDDFKKKLVIEQNKWVEKDL